ncbi:hypothetical protein NXV08_00115 (plasmid) [Bacteroides fragilis]|nr:hypothetical protein [Bacteroides fragilis]
MAGSYEVRNRYFKVVSFRRTSAHIRQSGEQPTTCYLSRDFMDYLSFLSIRRGGTIRNTDRPRGLYHLELRFQSRKAEGILADYSQIRLFP